MKAVYEPVLSAIFLLVVKLLKKGLIGCCQTTNSSLLLQQVNT